MITTTWQLLERAHAAVRDATTSLGDPSWRLATPCEQWNVAQVLRHAAGDQRAYGAAITGTGGPEEDPFSPAGTPPGDPAAFVGTALEAAARAFGAVAPGAGDVAKPLPLGPMPADLVVGAAALDAAVHAWDIAVATGQPSPLTAELAGELRPAAEFIVEPLRPFAFGPALAPEAGDDAAGSLLRFLGRDPRWSAR